MNNGGITREVPIQMDILLVHRIRVVNEIASINRKLACMRKEGHGRGEKSSCSSCALIDFSSKARGIAIRHLADARCLEEADGK
jgi:hypothetical protein